MISITGSGPPVLFATGLCNTMPSLGYSSFIKLLEQKLTIVTCDTGTILTPRKVRQISNDYFEDNPLGYIGHSSLLPSLLNTKDINRVVLLDPSCFPIAFNNKKKQFISKSIKLKTPVLIIDAEYASKSDFPFIPKGFQLEIDNAFKHEYTGVGHADILDDFYATTCNYIGIKGTPIKTSQLVRNKYRVHVAKQAQDFFN